MMNIQDFITKSEQNHWSPLVENGIHYQGILVKSLRYDAESGRSKTILLRFEAQASYPYHIHPAGEEIFVLEGCCSIAGAVLNRGDYLYTPPNSKHGVYSREGCTLLLSIPEEVQIIEHHEGE